MSAEIPCPSCKGRGKHKGYAKQKGTWYTKIWECDRCKGVGRLTQSGQPLIKKGE